MSIETRDVVIDGAIAPAFFARPAQPKGAVVLVHEIFGRAPELERACVRLAEGGYAALMPDLFGDRFKPVCIARCMGQITRGEGDDIALIQRAGDVVAQQAGVPRARVGVIGFCLGGGFALAVSGTFAATSANYATAVPPATTMQNMSPTIACYGSRDRSTKKSMPIIEQRMKDSGAPWELHVLEAGHAFLNDGDHPIAAFTTRPLLDVDPVRDTAARDEGWRRILAFFDRHLAP
jgi:carboxymethylenebutenolidase